MATNLRLSQGVTRTAMLGLYGWSSSCVVKCPWLRRHQPAICQQFLTDKSRVNDPLWCPKLTFILICSKAWKAIKLYRWITWLVDRWRTQWIALRITNYRYYEWYIFDCILHCQALVCQYIQFRVFINKRMIDIFSAFTSRPRTVVSDTEFIHTWGVSATSSVICMKQRVNVFWNFQYFLVSSLALSFVVLGSEDTWLNPPEFGMTTCRT